MIVVDTSALMAVFLEEPEGRACERVLKRPGRILVSAGTVAEALIVSEPRGVRLPMEEFLGSRQIEVVPVTPEFAGRMAQAYRRWGKGYHPANLNLGDCFAYVLARDLDAPLLFVGNDFAQTDLRPA